MQPRTQAPPLHAGAGTLVPWELPEAVFYVQPGNSGLCGQVPSTPQYVEWNPKGNEHLESLPEC